MLVEYLQSASRIRLYWAFHEKGGSSTWSVAGGKESPITSELISPGKFLLSMGTYRVPQRVAQTMVPPTTISLHQCAITVNAADGPVVSVMHIL